jgi:hypothetical protein
MGLRQLEWHEQRNEGWVARIKYGHDRFRRLAHVNILPLSVNRVPNKVLVHTMFGPSDLSWHDSVEAAKLHVEAIFALDN